MSKRRLKGFVAYPSQPPLVGETIEDAILDINKADEINLTSWRRLPVSGRLMIQTILSEIDNSDLVIADLTGINHNVLFEIGYAIAANKKLWFTLNTTRADSRNLIEQMSLLSTYGYAPYANHHDLVARFYDERPIESLKNTIFSDTIKPLINSTDEQHLLYLKLNHADQASVKVTQRIAKSFIPVISDDPAESTGQWLSWYGQKILTSTGVLCHLAANFHDGHRLHNARTSLIAGMAHGFRRKLLLIREGMELTPLDYRELLESYASAKMAQSSVDKWLSGIETEWTQYRPPPRRHVSSITASNELRGLTLGEYIAENEDANSLSDYFVETAAYQDALAGRGLLYVGRKGSGKTANMLRIQQVLQSKSGTLLCSIKPAAYELESLLALMTKLDQNSSKSYVIESMWKYLLVTEIAISLALRIEGNPKASWNANEQELIDVLNEHGGELRKDFAIRLENTCNRLLSSVPQADEAIEKSRARIAQMLHDDSITRLRFILGRALGGLDRVAVLIDNLDKPWDQGHDLVKLSEVLLGLLSAIGRVSRDFAKRDSRVDAIKVTWSIFLRSDIFSRIRPYAREPDKLTPKELRWDDGEMLLRVAEERFSALKAGQVPGHEFWTRCVCQTVNGIPTKDYILQRILQRPRDIIVFLNAAISWAINRGHQVVEATDFARAELDYSKFALESMLVENGISVSRLRDVIGSFVRSPAIITVDTAKSLVLKKGLVQEDKADYVVTHLGSLGFFGLEVLPNEFRFTDDPVTFGKHLDMATDYAKDRSAIRLSINVPFRPFLEITS